MHNSPKAIPLRESVFFRVFRAPHDYIYDAKLPHWIDGLDCLPPNSGAADCSIAMRPSVARTRPGCISNSSNVPSMSRKSALRVRASSAQLGAGGKVAEPFTRMSSSRCLLAIGS